MKKYWFQRAATASFCRDHLPVITPVPAAAASKKRTYKPYYYATLTEAQKEEALTG
ncbi:hypothetical protein DPMN_057111 [Dreissena polymorpha]|uniref:Uncharacterized protein n=1 Tax=Dreissena polymorpha TaxID=45954 RepID=A0A9D4CVL7_DREPO|nr:hypothetical protein DPMN_057111 [Dreissena polymorpha]